MFAISFVLILRGEAGVSQIPWLSIKFPQAAVVKLLVFVINNEGDNAEGQTILEQQ